MQIAQGAESPVVFDLEGISEKEALQPEPFARAARSRTLEQNAIYGGIVVAVTPREARVELAPGAQGTVPFSTMSWAREFQPEHATPAPRSAVDVLAVGDVVPVRVLRFSATRDAPDRQRITRLDLALEQTPGVQGAFIGMDLRTRQVLRSVSEEKTTKLGTGRFWVIDVEYRNQRDELCGVERWTGFGYRRGA